MSNLLFPTNLQEEALAVENGMLRHANGELQEEVGYLSSRITEVEESLLAVVDRFDSFGWKPLGTTLDNPQSMPLETVKKVAELSRALYAINPWVRSGVDARISYIWGKGVNFDGVEALSDQLDKNRKRVFSAEAYDELERALATDGNVFTALPVDKTQAAFRIPLSEISGAVHDTDDTEQILFYRRTHKVTKTDGRNGMGKEVERIVYYPSVYYFKKRTAEGKRLPATWAGVPVDNKYVLHHMSVNKQIGWSWGTPDIMPVIFWAKAYKEYLEDNALLVKAYSRIAWAVQSNNPGAATGAAAQLQRPPQRDPITGEVKDIGGTAVYGSATSMTPMAPQGSSVDFDKGSALAAAIAAGLGVSKVVILRDPGSGNRSAAETLDGPMVKAMEARQKLHEERFLDMFSFWGIKIAAHSTVTAQLKEAQEAEGTVTGRDYASVSWPQIESDSTKDRVAALGTLKELGLLHGDEARKEGLDIMGIAPLHPHTELPEKETPVNLNSGGNAEPSVIPKQGVSGGIAARGGTFTNDNEVRDNRKQDSGK